MSTEPASPMPLGPGTSRRWLTASRLERCPQIVTVTLTPSDLLRHAADPDAPSVMPTPA